VDAADLVWLRKLREQLAKLGEETDEQRAALRGEIAAEVDRLKAEGWSDGKLAEAFGVTRSAVMQWRERPG
jgi:recombinational DNA repair ATPase RecF